jgi:RNase H-fold protein (predicted Holliday junction resolvase)
MTATDRRVVLGIDPGRRKCGAAVCTPDVVLARAVVTPDALAGLVRDWLTRYGVTEVVVGNRTGSDAAVQVLTGSAVPIRRVDETGTTLRARARYFAEHPPKGWRRLVPHSLQTPAEPYDDYVAILLAEAALAGQIPQKIP